MDQIFIWGIAITALPVGFIVGYLIRKNIAAKSVGKAELNADRILKVAKDKEREILLSSKDKALQLIEDAKKEETKRREELTEMQTRLVKRESTFDQKLITLEQRQEDLTTKKEALDKMKAEIKTIRQQQIEKLEKVAGLDQTKAQEILLAKVEADSSEDLKKRLKKLDDASWEELEAKGKHMLSNVIQRVASSHAD